MIGELSPCVLCEIIFNVGKETGVSVMDQKEECYNKRLRLTPPRKSTVRVTVRKPWMIGPGAWVRILGRAEAPDDSRRGDRKGGRRRDERK